MNDMNKAAVPCPTCGNDDIDTLIWDDPADLAAFVTCVLCGTRYNPFTGQIQMSS
jgi:ribosomal protein S27E